MASAKKQTVVNANQLRKENHLTACIFQILEFKYAKTARAVGVAGFVRVASSASSWLGGVVVIHISLVTRRRRRRSTLDGNAT